MGKRLPEGFNLNPDPLTPTTSPAPAPSKVVKRGKATRKTRPPAPSRGHGRKPATLPPTTAQGGYRKPTELAKPAKPVGRRRAVDLDEPPVRVTVYLRTDQYLRLRRKAAERRGLDVSSLVREAVDKYLPPRS